jgi:hypothetical protein
LNQANEKVGNVDGSRWIRNQIERQSPPLDELGLDFYRLSENCHKARRENYGDDDEEGKEWAGHLLHVFKHDGYEVAWKQLLGLRVALKRGRPAADRLVSYVIDQGTMIKYSAFRVKGWLRPATETPPPRYVHITPISPRALLRVRCGTPSRLA